MPGGLVDGPARLRDRLLFRRATTGARIDGLPQQIDGHIAELLGDLFQSEADVVEPVVHAACFPLGTYGTVI